MLTCFSGLQQHIVVARVAVNGLASYVKGLQSLSLLTAVFEQNDIFIEL